MAKTLTLAEAEFICAMAACSRPPRMGEIARVQIAKQRLDAEKQKESTDG